MLVRRVAATARRAAMEERVRLARDLHDVAAHHLSSLVAQAEGLRARRPYAADRTDEAVDALAETGRRVMEDMRTLLGVLRADDDPGGQGAAPTPTLGDLPELIALAVRDGQDVTADLTAGPGTMPAARLDDRLPCGPGGAQQREGTLRARRSASVPIRMRAVCGSPSPAGPPARGFPRPSPATVSRAWPSEPGSSAVRSRRARRPRAAGRCRPGCRWSSARRAPTGDRFRRSSA